MKEELVAILEELVKHFVKTKQPDEIRSKLQLSGVLTVAECATIKACTLLDDQFLTMFNLLKSKDDEIFKNLQKICIELKWRDLLSLITNKLEDAHKKDLIIPYTEQLEHHDTFTYGFRYPIAHFTGREEHLKNINDFFQQSDLSKSENERTSSAESLNRILLITGLGGVGKTQLAITYMNKYKLDFDSIIWINAESESALVASFYGLASMLDIATEKLSIKSLTNKIFQKLLMNGMKHLAIFDNADQLQKEIMEEIVSDLSYKICIIITSRHQFWPNNKVINVDVFTPDEAKSFILKSINIAEGTNDDMALKLAQTLDYFPLALQQATAYIKSVKDYTIEDFLSEYEVNKINTKELFSLQLNEYNEEQSIGTIFATWKITLNKIKDFIYKETMNESQPEENVVVSLLFKTSTIVKMIFDKIKHVICKEKESLPLKIFYLMAYLASDNIPTPLFLDVINNDEMQLIWAIKVLEDFSLISVNSCLLKVHNIIQLVTQLQLAEEKRSVEFITTAIQLLVNNFPAGHESYDAIEQKRILLPHLAQVKFHTEKAGKENLLDKESCIELHSSMLLRMEDTYWNIGDVNSSQKVCKELLQIQEKHYGPDHTKVALTLSNLSNAYGNLGDPQTAKSLLERALVIQERHYGPDHLNLAVILSNLSNTYSELDDPQNAKAYLERALAIKEHHCGPDHFELAFILSNLSVAHMSLGDPQTAKTLLERALVIQEHHYGPDHFQLATTLSNLSEVHIRLGDPQTAKTLLERVLAIEEQHYDPDHFQLAATLSTLSNAYNELGDPQSVKTLLERALVIKERHYGPDHFQSAVTLSSLANAYGDLGDPQTAKSLLERALAIQEHHYGPAHLKLAVILSNLSNAYSELGDPRSAKAFLERALAIKEHHCGPDHFELAFILSNLSIAHRQLGDSQTAKTLLERALVIQERHYGPDHLKLATTLSNLANVSGDFGDPQTSKALLERALLIQEHHYGPDHFQLAVTLSNLSIAHIRLDDPQTAKPLLERALVIQEHHYGPHHFQLTGTLSNLAEVHRQLGDPQTAKTLLERALVIQEHHYGPDHFQLASTLTNLSNTYRDLGDPHTAKNLLERVLVIQKHHYGHDSEHF